MVNTHLHMVFISFLFLPLPKSCRKCSISFSTLKHQSVRYLCCGKLIRLKKSFECCWVHAPLTTNVNAKLPNMIFIPSIAYMKEQTILLFVNIFTLSQKLRLQFSKWMVTWLGPCPVFSDIKPL